MIAVVIAGAAVCHARTYDPHLLAQELRTLSSEIAQGEKSAVADSLPEAWTVESPEGSYPISTRPLRRLTGASGNDEDARAWLDQLAEQLDGYTASPSASPNAHRQLENILASREFSGLRPPTSWELFRERLNRAVGSFFKWLFSQIAAHPIGQQVLVWTIAAGAIGFLLFLLLRPLQAPGRIGMGESAIPPSRVWQEWARAAREAAANGNLREAIHAAYWCCVARLQDIGTLPSDAARTPREYLRLSRQQNASLIALTSKLERVWYAGRPATDEDVRNSFAELEDIGCRLD